MNEFSVNKVISDLETGSQYLVLWIDPNNDCGYWYDLSSSSRKPREFKMADIQTAEKNGRYELQDFISTQPILTEATITDTAKQHRDRLWEIIKPAVESEPDIYDRKLRITLLRRVADENNLDPSNLYALLDRYWRSGKTKNAFIPRYANCGAKGKPRKLYRNDGERRNRDASAGKTLTDSDRNHFLSALNKYYLTRNKLSLTVVYEKLLYDFYSIKSENNPNERKLFPPNERPTFRQFEYWYYKNRNIITEQKKRDGERAFELTGRSVVGKSDFGLMGPGAQFQMDATVGDIYLVSQFDRSNLISRPVLYFIIDAFSRMVTGMSVGLEGPSWAGAMMAIANMATDKVTYCKEYGIEITENEWPCRHIPSVLCGDRGELLSKNADNLVNMLGIRITNTPSYRADLKGIVEQHFRTINTNSIALLPGSVKPDMSKRGGHDYRLDAKLDIRQFTQIIIKCVLHYNSHHYMDYFEKSEAMMRDGVETIPIKLWEWGIQNCSGALRSFPEEQVRLAVMPTEKATVTAKGIHFKGMFYSSDRAVRELWFEKARSKRTWQISVSYDPCDMANIYVWDNDYKAHDICWLLDWNGKNAGKCLDEIVYEQRKEKIIAKQLKTSEIEAKVNLNAEIDAIVTEATGMSTGLPQKSKRELVSNIGENRRKERASIRLEGKEAADNDNVVTGIHQAYKLDEDSDPILQMIRGKVEERMKK
jgi:hypothetical protein